MGSRKTISEKRQPLRALDLFAGIGGSSWGARAAGADVVAAVDIWDVARETYTDNFRTTKFYEKKCEELNPNEVLRELGPINLLIASPECTSHTCAKGKAAVSDYSRETAFQVPRFAAVLKPRWVVIENVVHMCGWTRYGEWLDQLTSLGYHVREQKLNAADFGVAQTRRRLFVLCDNQAMPPLLTGHSRVRRAADAIVDRRAAYRFSPLFGARRAVPTLERAARAISDLGPGRDFLLVYYGTDGAGGWQRLDRPLRTITTLDRFAYVRAINGDYEMRMLQVPELKKAMGFPAAFQLRRGSRREQIRLLGNAVCPPVMKAIVTALTGVRINK